MYVEVIISWRKSCIRFVSSKLSLVACWCWPICPCDKPQAEYKKKKQNRGYIIIHKLYRSQRERKRKKGEHNGGNTSSPKVLGCMDYAAGGFTCPGVFLIPIFVEGIHRYYSLVFFCLCVCWGCWSMQPLQSPHPFFFFFFFLLFFCCVPCTNSRPG